MIQEAPPYLKNLMTGYFELEKQLKAKVLQCYRINVFAFEH